MIAITFFHRGAKTPYSGFSKSKAELDKAVLAAMKKHAKKGAKVEPCRTGPSTIYGGRQRP